MKSHRKYQCHPHQSRHHSNRLPCWSVLPYLCQNIQYTNRLGRPVLLTHCLHRPPLCLPAQYHNHLFPIVYIYIVSCCTCMATVFQCRWHKTNSPKHTSHHFSSLFTFSSSRSISLTSNATALCILLANSHEAASCSAHSAHVVRGPETIFSYKTCRHCALLICSQVTTITIREDGKNQHQRRHWHMIRDSEIHFCSIFVVLPHSCAWLVLYVCPNKFWLLFVVFQSNLAICYNKCILLVVYFWVFFRHALLHYTIQTTKIICFDGRWSICDLNVAYRFCLHQLLVKWVSQIG